MRTTENGKVNEDNIIRIVLPFLKEMLQIKLQTGYKSNKEMFISGFRRF